MAKLGRVSHCQKRLYLNVFEFYRVAEEKTKAHLKITVQLKFKAIKSCSLIIRRFNETKHLA